MSAANEYAEIGFATDNNIGSDNGGLILPLIFHHKTTSCVGKSKLRRQSGNMSLIDKMLHNAIVEYKGYTAAPVTPKEHPVSMRHKRSASNVADPQTHNFALFRDKFSRRATALFQPPTQRTSYHPLAKYLSRKSHPTELDAVTARIMRELARCRPNKRVVGLERILGPQQRERVLVPFSGVSPVSASKLARAKENVTAVLNDCQGVRSPLESNVNVMNEAAEARGKRNPGLPEQGSTDSLKSILCQKYA